MFPVIQRIHLFFYGLRFSCLREHATKSQIYPFTSSRSFQVLFVRFLISPSSSQACFFWVLRGKAPVSHCFHPNEPPSPICSAERPCPCPSALSPLPQSKSLYAPHQHYTLFNSHSVTISGFPNEYESSKDSGLDP